MIFLKFFIIALLYCYPLICVLIIDRPSDTVDLTVDSKRKQWPGPIRWNAWFLLPSQLFFRIFFEELTDEGHGQYSPLKYKSLEYVDWILRLRNQKLLQVFRPPASGKTSRKKKAVKKPR